MKKIRFWLAIKFNFLMPYLLSINEQEKLCNMYLRSHFRFFRFDISNITDEEIKNGIRSLSIEISKMSLTSKDLIDSCNNLGKIN